MLFRLCRYLILRWRCVGIALLLMILDSFYHTRALQSDSLQSFDAPFYMGCNDFHIPGRRANATFLLLSRNSDIQGAISTLVSVERRFNHRMHYPLVVLNDQPFSNEFKEAILGVTSGNVTFSVIPEDMWGLSSGLDRTRAHQAMEQQDKDRILYGNVPSYHYMCRFNSGFFFDVDALCGYRWYWRLEPDVEYTCDITYDPFVEMEDRGKKYGYVIALWELKSTVPSLFYKVAYYKWSRGIKDTLLWTKMVERSPLPWPFRLLEGALLNNRDTSGDRWNLCHFWSNFEIADMEWLRSKEYRDFFAYLDGEGGFFLERWGDAPVHTFAAALLLQDHELHHFRDWGYRHQFQYIPTKPKNKQNEGLMPMNDLQHQSIPEWKMHSDIIGCNCDINMERAEVVQPTCMNILTT